MRGIAVSLAAGVRAPWRRFGLVLTLWLTRLVPVLLVFGLPLYAQARAASAHHPDSGLLLDGAADRSGFVYAWTGDFFRDGFADAQERLFWLALVAWLLVTVVAGGITARLVHGDRSRLLSECGRYAGRFLRLGLVALFAFYVVDLLFNTFLLQRHEDAELLEHAQDFSVRKAWVRGLPFLALVYLVGLVHAYARIDIVTHDRRSSVLSFGRGLGTLVARLPWLLVVEAGMLLAAGAAILVAAFAPAVFPLSAEAGGLAVGLHLALAAVASFLRTGVEVGAMDARCRLLAGVEEPPEPSRNETSGSWLVETPDEPPLPAD